MTENPPGSGSPDELEQDTSLYPGADEADHAVWHEDLPPADDFHDDATATEAEVEDSPTAGAEEEDQAAEAAEAQKRGRKVLLATVGVVALVVGGLAFNQFSKPSISGNLALPIAGMTGVAATENAGGKDADKHSQANANNKGTVAGLSDLSESPKTAEADITAIYNAGVDKTIAPSANKVALPGVPAAALTNDKKTEPSQTTDVMAAAPKMPQGTKVVAAAPPAAVEAVAPAAGVVPLMPSAVDSKTLDKNTLQPLTMPKGGAAPNLAAAATSTAVTPEMTARLNDLTTQMEALRKSVEQMSQQTQALAAKADATHGNGDVTALVQRLNDLEAQLSANKAQKKAKAKQPAAITLPSTADGVAVDDVAEKPAKEVVKTSRVKKTAAAKKAKTKAVEHKAAADKGKWVLRAATPDAAWVAPSKETTSLRQVRVGDTLPGIGKIRAINQNGASWEVIGSKGSIR